MIQSAIFIYLLLVAQSPANAAPACYCQPGQACWPTEASWRALNSTIGGNLVDVKPLAYVCHDPDYDEAQCALIRSETHSSSFRSSQPGALQYQNWEAWPAKQEQCYVEAPRSVPCSQGRISLYSAVVRTAQHVQASVKFAAKYNIKLAIRNSGHDFLGRSAAPSSLQIFTHHMKDMAVNNDFTAAGFTGRSTGPKTTSVTVGAGVQLHDLYAYLGNHGLMVVGGSSNTVGLAGGYIQGGGHSILGWLHGMASDNALEFQVVLANGQLVYANAYQNSDLFYALRGGGGGTFGVVVSVTIKAYPDYPVIFTQLNYTFPAPNTAFWNGVEAFHNHLVALNDNGATGYYYITPHNPISSDTTVSTFVLYMWLVNQTDTSIIQPLFAPLISDIHNATEVVPAFEVIPFPSMSIMYASIFTGDDTTGLLAQLGSRLVSRAFFLQPGAASRITSTISSLTVGPGDYIEGNVVSGGQVAKNRNLSSGLNPAWRDTIVHLLFTRQWFPDTPFEEQAIIQANITNYQVPSLKALEPGKMGAYVNEADANEIDFQKSFWGPTYPFLYAIKKARDPQGLFIVRNGVGSEDWDDDGFCRLF
ncbi:hypothetical protein BJX65DRAFT_322349 [Aspergillus insuetus]